MPHRLILTAALAIGTACASDRSDAVTTPIGAGDAATDAEPKGSADAPPAEAALPDAPPVARPLTSVSALTVDELGSTATFTVTLDAPPTGEAAVSLSSSNVAEAVVSPSTVTFNAINWNIGQTVTVTGVADAVEDGDMKVTITAALGASTANLTVTNNDVPIGPSSICLTESGARSGGSCRIGAHAMSASGRFVAFEAYADDIVAGDSNGARDVFVADRGARSVRLVSVSSAGVGGNGASTFPSISDDGRVVVFLSQASNLVPADTNALEDVFVHDLASGTTTRVNVASDGGQANAGGSTHLALSADGRFVVFDSTATNLVPGDTNGARDVFVRDRLEGTIVRASVSSSGAQGNGDSHEAVISGDGRLVAFTSRATNFVPGDTADEDVFLFDRIARTTVRVSNNVSGGNANRPCSMPSISADGRFIAFFSPATNLAGFPYDLVAYNRIYRQELATGARDVHYRGDYVAYRSSLTADGATVCSRDNSGIWCTRAAKQTLVWSARECVLNHLGGVSADGRSVIGVLYEDKPAPEYLRTDPVITRWTP